MREIIFQTSIERGFSCEKMLFMRLWPQRS